MLFASYAEPTEEEYQLYWTNGNISVYHCREVDEMIERVERVHEMYLYNDSVKITKSLKEVSKLLQTEYWRGKR